MESAILWSVVAVVAITAIYFVWGRKLGKKAPDQPHLPNHTTTINT